MLDHLIEDVKLNIYDCHTTVLFVYTSGNKVLLRYRRTPEELVAGLAVLRQIADTNPLFRNILDTPELREADF